MEIEPAWYIVKTKPNAERQVIDVLERRHVGSYLPFLESGNRPKWLFPGYVFVHLGSHKDYVSSRNAPGINYFLLKGVDPVPIADEIIRGIMARSRGIFTEIRDPALSAKERNKILLTTAFGELAVPELAF